MQLKAGRFALVSGFVPRDADVRQTQTGKLVVNFSVKSADIPGENGERTAQWTNCVAWQDVADVAKYIGKGDRVLCAGELQTRSYTKRDGDTATVTELICDFISIMEPPSAAPHISDRSTTAPSSIEDVSDDDLPF